MTCVHHYLNLWSFDRVPCPIRPIGSTYSWPYISLTLCQIFEKISGFFCGPPWTSNPSKSRDLTGGFWGRGWGRKKFDPPYLPPRGSWGPKNFYPWGSTRTLLNCQISRFYTENWGQGVVTTVFIFFNRSSRESCFAGGVCPSQKISLRRLTENEII